jgi:predicted tellurium resistance membrane protein TerC
MLLAVDKLPPQQRDKARLIGLSLAMLMRLCLLTIVSWLVTLATPLFSLGSFAFGGRDLILLAGGLFLLFKATVELHERLEGVAHAQSGSKAYAGFATVVAQVVVLDAVFSRGLGAGMVRARRSPSEREAAGSARHA